MSKWRVVPVTKFWIRETQNLVAQALQYDAARPMDTGFHDQFHPRCGCESGYAEASISVNRMA